MRYRRTVSTQVFGPTAYGERLAEHAAVAVISRFYEMACKVSIVGDPKQNEVFNAPDDEFSRTIKRSLMIMLMDTGVPYTMLSVQYRMHSHVSSTVSHLFYDDQFTDNPTVANRPENAI